MAAAEWVERRISRKLMPQTWELVVDYFPADEVRLPFGPLQSVVSIKYDDGDGFEQTLDPADYYLDDASEVPWVFPTDDWPSDILDAVNSVRVQFIAGYANAASVPAQLKAAVHLKVGELYEGDDNERAIHGLLTNYYQIAA